MPETIPVKVKDLLEGDLVDLEGTGYFVGNPYIESEYAEVSAIEPETPDCTCIGYEGLGAIGYDPEDTVQALAERYHELRKDTGNAES